MFIILAVSIAFLLLPLKAAAWLAGVSTPGARRRRERRQMDRAMAEVTRLVDQAAGQR